MKKLTLDVDAIQVASFEAAPPVPERGTVDGYQRTPDCPLTLDISCWCSEYATCEC
jgi:hypothetical protein